jgi:hypothetical protein
MVRDFDRERPDGQFIGMKILLNEGSNPCLPQFAHLRVTCVPALIMRDESGVVWHIPAEAFRGINRRGRPEIFIENQTQDYVVRMTCGLLH